MKLDPGPQVSEQNFSRVHFERARFFGDFLIAFASEAHKDE
jgi:hypothetical protein